MLQKKMKKSYCTMKVDKNQTEQRICGAGAGIKEPGMRRLLIPMELIQWVFLYLRAL